MFNPKITLGLVGFTLLASAAIPFSQASRDAYHSYLYKQIETQRYAKENLTNYRPHTIRTYTSSFAQSGQTKPSNVASIRNLRYPSHNKRNYYGGSASSGSSDLPLRTHSRAISPIGNFSGSDRTSLSVPRLDDINVSLVNHVFGRFIARLPVTAAVDTTKNNTTDHHYFTDSNSETSIIIKYFKPEVCNESISFSFCAIDISKKENKERMNGSGKLLTTSRIIRQNSFSDTVVLNNSIQTKTYTESFAANVMDSKKEHFFSRYFVAGLEGGVYMISTEFPLSTARKNIAIANAIFDAFRIKETLPLSE